MLYIRLPRALTPNMVERQIPGIAYCGVAGTGHLFAVHSTVLAAVLIRKGWDVKKERLVFKVAKPKRCGRCLDFHPLETSLSACPQRCLRCLGKEHTAVDCKEEGRTCWGCENLCSLNGFEEHVAECTAGAKRAADAEKALTEYLLAKLPPREELLKYTAKNVQLSRVQRMWCKQRGVPLERFASTGGRGSGSITVKPSARGPISVTAVKKRKPSGGASSGSSRKAGQSYAAAVRGSQKSTTVHPAGSKRRGSTGVAVTHSRPTRKPLEAVGEAIKRLERELLALARPSQFAAAAVEKLIDMLPLFFRSALEELQKSATASETAADTPMDAEPTRDPEDTASRAAPDAERAEPARKKRAAEHDDSEAQQAPAAPDDPISPMEVVELPSAVLANVSECKVDSPASSDWEDGYSSVDLQEHDQAIFEELRKLAVAGHLVSLSSEYLTCRCDVTVAILESPTHFAECGYILKQDLTEFKAALNCTPHNFSFPTRFRKTAQAAGAAP